MCITSYILCAPISMDNQDKKSLSLGLNLAWELGYLIAIPIIIFAFVGRALDRKFDTSPWLLLAGIFIALIISGIAVGRKSMAIIKDTEKK